MMRFESPFHTKDLIFALRSIRREEGVCLLAREIKLHLNFLVIRMSFNYELLLSSSGVCLIVGYKPSDF